MTIVFGSLRWSRCGKSDEARRLYKAQLCSSCHAMHRFSGRHTSLLANYDQSLLVMVLSALAGGSLQQRRCTAVPWRQVAVQDLPQNLRRYVAAGNLALIDAKLRDDQDDGTRWYAGLARFVLRRKVRKAHRELAGSGFDVALVTQLPTRQSAVEEATLASGAPDLAALAEPSAELLAEVFAFGGELIGGERIASRAAQERLRRFGHAVARAVYVFDAIEDHDEDRTNGSFNAVAALATRVGHEAAVAAARQYVELAAVEAQQVATQLLPEDRHAIVAEILQQMTKRTVQLSEQLLGRPVAAALRPAEAGDCDCACDGCDCGDCGGGSSCDCCCHCDACCWGDRRTKSAGKVDEEARRAEQ